MKRWQVWAIGAMFAIAGATFIAIGFYGVERYSHSAAKPGPCVPNVPREIVDGKIRHDLWMMYYYLGYAGEREESGAACTAWREVLEAEYERRMYGQE